MFCPVVVLARVRKAMHAESYPRVCTPLEVYSCTAKCAGGGSSTYAPCCRYEDGTVVLLLYCCILLLLFSWQQPPVGCYGNDRPAHRTRLYRLRTVCGAVQQSWWYNKRHDDYEFVCFMYLFSPVHCSQEVHIDIFTCS